MRFYEHGPGPGPGARPGPFEGEFGICLFILLEQVTVLGGGEGVQPARQVGLHHTRGGEGPASQYECCCDLGLTVNRKLIKEIVNF